MGTSLKKIDFNYAMEKFRKDKWFCQKSSVLNVSVTYVCSNMLFHVFYFFELKKKNIIGNKTNIISPDQNWTKTRLKVD